MLADQRTAGVCDLATQVAVRAWARMVMPAADHADRPAAGGQRGCVRGAIDAHGHARDDDNSRFDQPRGDLAGEQTPGRRGPACAD